MTPAATEAWARRGTAADMVVMAQIVACLDSASRGTLRQCAVLAIEKQRGVPADESHTVVCPHPADPLVCAIEVMDAYSALRVAGKATVLGTAVGLVAAMRLRSATARAGTWEDEEQWLRALANDTYPHGDDVAGLLSFAKGVEACWEEALFPDGAHEVVVVPSEHELTQGEGILAGYNFIQCNSSAMYRPPDPAGHLGVEVPKTDFREWDGDGWTVDEDRWNDAVQDATVLRFGELVAHWRARFFRALISGQEPDAR